MSELSELRETYNRLVMTIGEYQGAVTKTIDKLRVRISKLERARRGIPVSERLPEDRATVLVAFTEYPEHVSFSVATYYKHYPGIGNYWDIEDYHWGDPTYWWPLPQLEEVEQ